MYLHYTVVHNPQFVYDNGDRRQGNEHLEVPCPYIGSMQIELLNRKKWRTKIELSIAIAEWIEHFYNPERLHSSLGYVPPEEFEALHSGSAASIQT